MHYFFVYITSTLLTVNVLAANNLLSTKNSATPNILNETEHDQIDIIIKPLYDVNKSDFVNLQETKSKPEKVDIFQQDLAK
ncbi:MAG: hypothetical protein DRG24_08735 [Epsilonproteobacteria bacterium]|nr:MAG: hypothetical protein DRG24_08735 [Campylobacterota bacterium]